MKKERNFSLDAVRAGAAILVIAVHFFLHTGFYDLPLTGPVMAMSAWLRMAFMPCVPLFLMLSGYFCAERRWSRRYPLGLIPVLLTYLLCGTVCLLFRVFYMKEPVGGVFGAMKQYLAFAAAPYGWYVAMYVGLFLLMPFLNALWRGLDIPGRRALLPVLFLLVSLPTITNLFFQILPDWWLNLYPAAYYLLGVRLREMPERMSRLRGGWLLLIWLALAAAAAALRWAFAGGGTFTWTSYTDYNSVFVAGEAVCAFLLLRRCRGGRLAKMLRSAISRIAQISLPVFLLSYIFDALFYPVLNNRIQTLQGRLPFLPLMVLLILLCSSALGELVDLAAKGLLRLMPGREQTKE